MYKCKLCEYQNESVYKFCSHINNFHKLKTKEYYDSHIKELDSDMCKCCTNKTKFKGINIGYAVYCSTKCMLNDPEMRDRIDSKIKSQQDSIAKKREITCVQKYGSKSPMQCDAVKQKLKNTMNEKYGVDHYSQTPEFTEKMKSTCLEKYGVDWFSKTDEYKENIKINNRQKYGVDYYSSTNECREKVKSTMMENYGVDNYSKTDEYKEKTKKTWLKKYNVDNPSKSPEIIDKIIKIQADNFYKTRIQNMEFIPMFSREEYIGATQEYNWKCKKCGNIFSGKFNNNFTLNCNKCNPIGRSVPQKEILLFIESFGLSVQADKRTILKELGHELELDLYIPSKKLAIEFNGNYWHSELQGKDKKYHVHKTNSCEFEGIKLIHIFEDEWRVKPNIVKSRIKHALGLTKYKIYARNCDIKEISVKRKNKFLLKYHIQGGDKSAIHLGAFYKNRLIAVMTFCKLRVALGNTGITNHWELSRFCTISNFNVIGIASKLVKYFERNYSPEKLMSYADRRWSQGGLYKTLGFTLHHISKPNYWYLAPRDYLKRIHRYNFRKSVLNSKLTNFDPNLSEWGNMKANGYNRIWDCGSYVFHKEYNK